jgi:hypothetical protein
MSRSTRLARLEAALFVRRPVNQLEPRIKDAISWLVATLPDAALDEFMELLELLALGQHLTAAQHERWAAYASLFEEAYSLAEAGAPPLVVRTWEETQALMKERMRESYEVTRQA